MEEAVKGVDHVIHLASPIARKNPATDLETSPSEEERCSSSQQSEER